MAETRRRLPPRYLVARDDQDKPYTGALRSGERDVAQRVSLRAPQKREAGNDDRRVKSRNRDSLCNRKGAVSANPESERAGRSEQPAPQTVLNNW